VASHTKVADNTIETLATNLVISGEAIREAYRRELLTFTTHRGLPCWRFGDARNGCFRRLDGEPFRINGESVKAEADSRGESWHRLIGIDDVVANDRRDVLLTPEGSKDALAALHFAHAEGRLASIGIVAALGSAVTVTPADLEKLRGRRVRICPDVDSAGQVAGERIGQAIAAVAAETQVFDFANLHRGDGSEVKDLFDVTQVGYADFETNRELWSITDLSSKGNRLRVIQPLHEDFLSTISLPRESPEFHVYPVYHVSNSQELERELQQLAIRNACTAPNTARESRFKLARDLAAVEERICRKLASEERIRIFETWHARSRPHLDVKKTREDYFAKFLWEREKVQVPTGGGEAVKKALERIASLPVCDLPELPGVSKEGWRRLAALHRELARQSSDGTYFLSCRDAAKAHPSLNKDSANDINHALDSIGVVKLVKVGEAKPGGGASVFKYLLSR